MGTVTTIIQCLRFYAMAELTEGRTPAMPYKDEHKRILPSTVERRKEKQKVNHAFMANKATTAKRLGQSRVLDVVVSGNGLENYANLTLVFRGRSDGGGEAEQGK